MLGIAGTYAGFQFLMPLIGWVCVSAIASYFKAFSRMIPWMQRVGIDGVLPLERQAGVDLMKLREQYPNFLFIGHFDKMVMPLGEAAMRAEFDRILPVMRQGGFIPSVDHQTPPGVSLENYRVYLRLLKEYCEKAVQK